MITIDSSKSDIIVTSCDPYFQGHDDQKESQSSQQQCESKKGDDFYNNDKMQYETTLLRWHCRNIT